ncbi:hypothetical protein F5148DRAFT_1168271 [Russula earlei]|uniref:Uncharacterized protein n=1 Tax=Russula earlei TaxID=71964 RepID=A0ACC0ULL7_9AGAM|nr:hypothetical protein F5148DRAFT_1168271 [Russula earlei]
MISEDASRYPQDASDDDHALLSPNGAAPPWPRPRSPIPPHRLAKLANALGISAPVPLSQGSNDSILSPKPLTPEARRSPAPSTSQLASHSPVPFFHSRFLLHIVPPPDIPHDFNSSESFQLTPPPPSASGYHPQFERGTLVPLFPTLQTQLWAIAKEYALPSTAGMILYLVSSAQSPNPEANFTAPVEPGPRLSEDIWKHLWTRVAKFEAETYSRVTTPNTPSGLGLSYLGPPSPLLPQPQDFPSSSNSLRPLISPGRVTPQSFPPPHTPTGSTASSNPPTRSETSQSETNTLDTSLPSHSHAAILDLPGLISSSVIPILAKIEFDIDKRKAAWYGPWIRSRKLNHQKREERARAGSDSGSSPMTEYLTQGDSEADAPKVAPLPLRLVDRQAIPRFLLSTDEGGDCYEMGHPRLTESPPSVDDPNPTSASVPFAEESETEDNSANSNNEEVLHVMRESQERPKLSLNIPSSPPDANVLPVVTNGASKKGPPPPLTLIPYTLGTTIYAEPSPLPASDSSSSRLPYLRSRVPTPSDGAKRTGTVFDDDLDLGLDFEDSGEFDESDPNDRRRSQYVFKAKLDEIEKTLVRFSPRGLQIETRPPPPPLVHGPTPASANSVSFPSNASVHGPTEQGSNELPNRPSTVSLTVPNSPSQQHVKTNSTLDPESDNFLVLPKLSLNGGSSPVPASPSPYKKAFSIQDTASHTASYESTAYPEIDSPLSRKPAASPIIPLSPDPFGRYPSSQFPPTSPLRPPKPKGSTFDIPPEQRSSRSSLSHKVSLTGHVDAESRPPSSRFSLDSTEEGKNNRASVSLYAVKSIKSLWKRGRKASISFSSGTGSTPASQPGTEYASTELPPPVPSLSSTSTPQSLTPEPCTVSRESVTSLTSPSERPPPKTLYYDTPSLLTAQIQHSHSTPSINSMLFNQESPYPVHVLSPNTTYRPRTASQTARMISTASLTDVDVAPPTPPPPASATSATEREKVGAPKSILKSRRTDSPLPSSEQLAMRSRRSRADSVARPSTLMGGGGHATPTSSSFDPSRVSPTSTRTRLGRAPTHSRPSPDERTGKTIGPMPPPPGA